MKRFIYHYLCLLVALAMTGWFWLFAFAFAVPKYMNDELFALIFVVLGLLILILLIDAPLRGLYEIDNKILMIILSLITAPIRFFCQLVTVIFLHISYARGNRNYAIRKEYSSIHFSSWFKYLLFNTNSLSLVKKTEHAYTPKRIEKKVRMSKNEKQRQYWNEIQNANKKRIEEVAWLRGNVSKPTVYILPVLSNGIDCGLFSMFDGRWNSILSTEEKARITRLYVNGIDYTYYDGTYRNYISCTGLYLKSGTYDFIIEYELNILPPINSNNYKIYKANNKYELKGVKVNENGEVYLGLIIGLNYFYNEVNNSLTGEKYNEHSHWRTNRKFTQLSVDEMNGLVPQWRDCVTKLDGSIPRNCLVI